MKEERFPHTRKPLRGWRLREAEGGSFGAAEESIARGVRRAKWRHSRTEDRGRPALTSPRGLSAHLTARAGLRAEARALEVRSQGEDWGWRREHSLKGASAPRLAGRESGTKPGPAEEARGHCVGVREETGFRALPKRAPETGASRGFSADPRDGHETLRLLLQPPRIMCASTGHSPHLPSWEPVQPATARVP